MMNATLRGKPDAGNPHVRFDEGEVAQAKPRRGSLLYKKLVLFLGVACGLSGAFGAERMDPVLPGWGAHFWNAVSVWYLYPPAFDYMPVAGAVKYRFTVADGAHTVEFDAEKPTESLASVWGDIRENGLVSVQCRGVDAKGALCGFAGEPKTFWKTPAFRAERCPKAKRPYAEAAKLVYDYVFGLDYVKHLAATGRPDFGYRYNCYPSKMNAALVRAGLRLGVRDPKRRAEGLALARAAADYLISISEPAGAPLAYFSPTYASGNTNYTSKAYQGQSMLLYPAEAANAYLNLFKATGEAKYRAAAERTAETYLRLQGADGTWYLKLWMKDGRPVNPNRLFPLLVCELFESLYALTGRAAYRTAADRAFAFIEKGPFADWNWEGQFEDVKPSAKYRNLTKHPPTSVAMYLLRRFPGDATRLRQARELLRFSEDQFVAWERPARADGFFHTFKYSPTGWTTFPTVMEQYDWYVPTDSSVAKMIRTYLALYDAEKNPLDLAKARALGAALTNAQLDSGRIPTQWMGGSFLTSTQSDWVNCMLGSAAALERLAEYD